MKTIMFKLLGRVSDLIDVQPVIALFLGGAFLAVFLTALFQSKTAASSGAGTNAESPAPSGLFVLLYYQLGRFLWALTLVAFLIGALSLLRAYLHQTLSGFQRNHGRVTEANYNAVQTIWGAEQVQGELHGELFWTEEVTERIESEDLTRPAVLRKKMVRHNISENPFLAARHEVILRQNPRKKGSALYGGYETVCRFGWKLINPAGRDLTSVWQFPLPAAGAMYDDLVATLNGQDVLPRMQLKDGALVLERPLKANETFDLALSFKSRGMSFWYLQVKEPREVRDFSLTLTLPDLSKARLNYPEGCMTPTSINATPDNQGSILAYRLDHAISSKGMGISLPAQPQPGATTNAVLLEVERGWLLIFAMLVLGLAIGRVAQAVLLSILFGAATACAFGLLGDFSDLLFGFWGTAAIVLVPTFLFLAWLLAGLAASSGGRILGGQLLLFGIAYPCAAGLDSNHQSLYFDLCAVVFLALAARQFLKLPKRDKGAKKESLETTPAGLWAPPLTQSPG